MPTRPRLVRSIPYWILVAVSLAAVAGGAYLLSERLGTMTSTLTAGTATGVDVYVGQSVAVLGAVLVGAGVVGILLALTVAAAATLRPHPPVETAAPIDWEAETSAADDLEGAGDKAEVRDDEATDADEEPAAEKEPVASTR